MILGSGTESLNPGSIIEVHDGTGQGDVQRQRMKQGSLIAGTSQGLADTLSSPIPSVPAARTSLNPKPETLNPKGPRFANRSHHETPAGPWFHPAL